MKVAYLKITTWVGSAVGYAQHYYGTIYFGDNQWSAKTPKKDVKFKIDSRQAIEFNKEEPDLIRMGLGNKPGDMSTRFTDRDMLIKKGTKLFKKDPKGCDVLLEGDSGYVDPHKMLAGPKDVMEKGNKLYEEFEEYDGWGCKPEEEKDVRRISNAWSDATGIYQEYKEEGTNESNTTKK